MGFVVTERKSSSEADESGKTRAPGRRERRRAEVRERLYQAALDLINDRGFQATTVKDITEAADVGKGTFFNYFPTKEHFWLMYYENQQKIFEEAQRAVGEGGESVRQAIKKLMWRMSAKPTPALVHSFLLAMFANQSVAAIVIPQLYKNRQRFEALLTIGQKRGEVRRDKTPAELARTLHEIGFGTTLFWSFRPTVPLDTLLEANLDLVFNQDLVTTRPSPKKNNVRTHRRSQVARTEPKK
jgi:AcrR family transcriptional regulator